MPEMTANKVEEGTRRYMREAEEVARDAYRVGNDFFTTTMNYYFNMFDRMIHDTLEITTKNQHIMEDMMGVYRRMYETNMKAWEKYIDDVNKIIRPAK